MTLKLATSTGSRLHWSDAAHPDSHFCWSPGAGVTTILVGNTVSELTTVGVFPGPDPTSLVWVQGRPGGDYGYLHEQPRPGEQPASLDAAAARPLVRSANVVWARDGRSLTYTAYDTHCLDAAPVEGLQVRRHRPGQSFELDDVLDLVGGRTLITLTATSDDTVLIRQTCGRTLSYRHLSSGAHTSEPLWPDGDHRPPHQVLPGSAVWWTADRLGRTDFMIRAVNPLDGAQTSEVRLPAGWLAREVTSSRTHLFVRACTPTTEAVFAVAGTTLQPVLLPTQTPRSTISDLQGSARGDVVGWVESTPAGKPRQALLRSVAGSSHEPVTVVTTALPAKAPARRTMTVARDEQVVSVYITVPAAVQAPPDEPRPTRESSASPSKEAIVLEHTGPRGFDRLPLESGLEQVAARRGAKLVRVRARPLGLARASEHGTVAYDDILTGLTAVPDLQDTRVVLVGYSMGAIAAARALLRAPQAFAAAIFRFPVSDLVQFAQWGIGSLWCAQIGDPADPRDEQALQELSPCHMTAPRVSGLPVLIQVGRYDTRADPRHGLGLARRLEALGYDVAVRHYATGHDESHRTDVVTRAVDDATQFASDVLDRQDWRQHS